MKNLNENTISRVGSCYSTEDTATINFEIKGKVKAKQSFKISRSGFKYTPSDMVEYANYVKMCFMQKYPNHLPSIFYDKQLGVKIDVYFAIPKNFSKKKHEQALQGIIRPLVKPDCDNIAKNINDAMNGIVYPDDKQIVSLTVNKYYSDNERVEVYVDKK